MLWKMYLSHIDPVRHSDTYINHNTVFQHINLYNPSNIFACHDWSKHVTWPNIPQLKLGNIREYSPIFKTARVAKKIWRIIKTI